MPVSAGRWWHGSCMCFATFYKLKITKLLQTHQPLKKVEKLALRSLEIFNACLTKFESNQILLNQNSH